MLFITNLVEHGIAQQPYRNYFAAKSHPIKDIDKVFIQLVCKVNIFCAISRIVFHYRCQDIMSNNSTNLLKYSKHRTHTIYYIELRRTRRVREAP